ncbi:GIY-YIG nuclease family protein [Evansella tamaricis]|uniref:GIY-YIG nuclease family protein n=1 Tax=Evansella tamaricis TaxID=2069301 RepID=A0ABS6JJ39_9BACI|nr:GIY-YIG nuclease family protein [Evansella tamaricis]MBU9713704.1 GIY-YIG nuclease family protein [Evansella tamaricis]
MKTGNRHFVYIIRCKDSTYYTGYTTDVEKRVKMHQSGKGAKYTRGRGPIKLVYEEAFATKEEAMRREYQIKQLARDEKEKMINQGGDVNVHTTKLS